ncbi:MAG: hypothetical protein ACJ76J_13255 [Thermoanaerobaculia bacterium]
MYDYRTILAIIKRLKWLLITFAYVFAIESYGIRAVLVFLILIGLSLAAYRVDKDREEKGVDHFRGGRLFYRYGDEVEKVFFSLPTKSEWDADEIAQFAKSLQERLGARLQARVPTELVSVKDLQIADLSTQEAKAFLRILAKSRFGSTLTHFVHYASFGRTLTAHYFTYLRGTFSEWELVKFAIASPFTIWVWGVPWLLNQHSIISDISQFRSSSFDGVDIRTLYSMTKVILYEETEKILKEAGLLTEEVQQIINIHKHSHVNNLSISNSSNVNLSNVSQSAGVAPVLKAS